MREDLELARFKLECRWSELTPTWTSIKREPSGAIAIRIQKSGLRQIAKNEKKLVQAAGCHVHIYLCLPDSERLCLRFTSGS